MVFLHDRSNITREILQIADYKVTINEITSV